ncbi:hypothetical protein MMC28_009983 [Mycoblastus sanguinarius]|nr:hypothetical protein [Mycoblastus sanguinarius]
MGLTLFQPALNASALNASAVPVGVFPAPVSPDLYSCRGYYSYPSPPTAADCRIALSQIPQSTEPVPWYDLPGPGREHVLPISVQHGTCQILFHISGPESQTASPTLTYIVPKQVWEMAGWILSRCVSTGRGGFVTKGLLNSISWLVDPNINFQEDPYPTSMNFYSLHIWSTSDGEDDSWNPGNYEFMVGEKILQAVEAAEAATAPDSPEREDFAWRQEYIREAVVNMDDTDDHTWWDAPRPRLEGPAGNTSIVLKTANQSVSATDV